MEKSIYQVLFKNNCTIEISESVYKNIQDIIDRDLLKDVQYLTSDECTIKLKDIVAIVLMDQKY